MLILLVVIAVPLLLIATGIIPHRFRWHVLGMVCIAAVVITIAREQTWFDIGIRSDTLVPAAIGYGIFVIVGYAAIRWYSSRLGLSKAENWKSDSHFRYLFIPISLAQQFVFMSFTLTRLKEVLGIGWLAIIMSVIIFTLAHAGYGNWRVQLLLALVGGAGFSVLYYFFPNLIIASLAHMALNLIAVYYGFFTTTASRAAINQ
ncbi:MAG: CPBP family intramembrane metalloprotease [Candidatus Kerfeldbacteria bacterium]|nr:CPBP family intramembrane metalloprotease [Candidatus Kerfeldbacteria bacterium]